MALLRTIWEAWKRLAHRIGVFNTKLLLFLFYYVVLGPTGMLVRAFQRDMLGKRIEDGSLYHPVSSETVDLDRARRQF